MHREIPDSASASNTCNYRRALLSSSNGSSLRGSNATNVPFAEEILEETNYTIYTSLWDLSQISFHQDDVFRMEDLSVLIWEHVILCHN